MTVGAKIKMPRKLRASRIPADARIGSEVWIFQWVWVLDPKAGAADIRGYKKSITDYLKAKLNRFNERNGTRFTPDATFSKRTEDGKLKLFVSVNLDPAPGGGQGELVPPKPPQPPPPSL